MRSSRVAARAVKVADPWHDARVAAVALAFRASSIWPIVGHGVVDPESGTGRTEYTRPSIATSSPSFGCRS